MKKFKVGDIVVALKTHPSHAYIKDNKYEVIGTRIITCRSCGARVFSIDIGVITRDPEKLIHAHDNPCNKLMGTFTERWFSSINFDLVADDIEETRSMLKEYIGITYKKAIDIVQHSKS